MQLQVANCYKPLIDKLKRDFGGTIQRHLDRYNRHARPSWRWCLSEQAACRFAKKLLPYLFIKKRQARLLLQLGLLKKGNGSQRLTNHQIRQRLEIARECKRLNKRGRV